MNCSGKVGITLLILFTLDAPQQSMLELHSAYKQKCISFDFLLPFLLWILQKLIILNHSGDSEGIFYDQCIPFQLMLLPVETT